MSKYLINRVRLGIKILQEVEDYLLGADSVVSASNNESDASPFSASKIEKKSIKNAILAYNHDSVLNDEEEVPTCPEGMDPDDFIDSLINQKSTLPKELVSAMSVNDVDGMEGDVATPKLLEGSYYKRKDGRWHGRYRDNGKTISVYAQTKVDVINLLNERIVRRNQDKDLSNHGQSNKVSLSEAIDIWYKEWLKAKRQTKPLSAATISNVQSTIIAYIKDHRVAKKSITRITPDDLDLMFDSIPTKSMQARTFGYLNQVFDRALKRKIIKDNPMMSIEKRARPSSKKMEMPSIDLWFEFLDFVKEKSPDVYFISAFATWTGMRLGEILALTWNDISIESGWIAVNKSFDTHNQQIQDHPKTDAGFRNVPIFHDLEELLKEIPKKKNTPIFWMCSTWTINKKVVNWMNRFGKLPKMTFHSIRHLFASICHSAGVDKKTYSKWMGHANFGITQGLYTHILSDFELEQIALMAKNSRYKK